MAWEMPEIEILTFRRKKTSETLHHKNDQRRNTTKTKKQSNQENSCMSNSYFRFKQFTVHQEHCAMKVGSDGVLLGAWVDCSSETEILDIGTGTGLISLMLAQRTKARITGIDIDAGAYKQACENVHLCKWKDQISIHHCSLQDFTKKYPEKFSLIVSNPPYFVQSLKANSSERTMARHTDTLSHDDLLAQSMQLSTSEGKLYLILPVNEAIQCIEKGYQIGWYCTERVMVIPKPGLNPKRVLLKFEKTERTQKTSEITIETMVRNEYSPAFARLLKDYYLKL